MRGHCRSENTVVTGNFVIVRQWRCSAGGKPKKGKLTIPTENPLPSPGSDGSPKPNKPIRVVVNGIHAKSGGGLTYIRELVPRLARLEGLEVHLFLHRDQFPLFYPIDENIRPHLFDYKQGSLSTLAWEQLAVPVLIREMAADIVFSPANFGPLMAKNHVILLRNAVSVIKVESRLFEKFYWLSLGLATLASVFSAKKAIAVSNYAKKDLTFGLLNYFQDKIDVVYHGTSFRRSARTGPPEGRPFVLAVSDIYVQKNFHTLIPAFARVVESHPEIDLMIAGQVIDSDYMKRLGTIIERHGLADRIHFLGRVETDELHRLYRDCRVFVFPSLIESFGNPLLEAMAEGAPIACSDCAAMPEIVGHAGLMFDPEKPEDMAEKIITLLEDDGISKSLSDLAVKRAVTFTWERTAEETRAVFRSIMGIPGDRR